MPLRIAIAAASLLISGSTGATTIHAGPSPAVHSTNGPAARLAQARLRRLQIPTWRASFSGNVIDLSGKRYDAKGEGTFWLVIDEGSQMELKYSVTMTAYPTSFPYDAVELGEMRGQGPTDGSGPERIGFAIHGMRNDRGNILDVYGNIFAGRLEGAFQIPGDNVKGQGDIIGQ